ncbi:pentatricopeptide repeat-containing protein At1g18900-like isoform X1 [Ananas comosus]|nr:pentatricopeptide repeat-containing protein At1g18900-like isoform X1 [Ananas comosus]XP_020086681.1 pentatricopeptide repeat-containing protein At1g18900-like isoform X1 [Ananas comosus]
MLRTKQLSTLTQCARSFYLSGPRSGSSDGASCTGSEDETCVSKRQLSKTTSQQKKANVSVAETPPQAARPHVANAIGPINHRSSSYLPSVAPHIISSSSTLKPGFSESRSSYVLAGDQASQSSILHSSKPITGQYVKPNKSNNSKGQPNSSNNIVATSDSNSNSNSNSNPDLQSEFGDRSSRGVYVKANQSTSGTFKTQAKNQRQSLHQKAKFHSGSVISEDNSMGFSDKKVLSSTAGNFSSISKSRNPTRSVNTVRTVEQYYHTLQLAKWGPGTEQALNNLHSKLDPFQANQVLKLLRDHSIALGFFRWLKAQPGFRHDDHTYTTMIGILGQSRQFGAMRKLLEEMIRDGFQPTVVTYNRLIHAYGRANYINEAVKVFEEMQEAGYEPDRVTYCTLIDIHAKAGYLDIAMDLYRRMQEMGLSPDTFTYSVMVNCLGKAGHLAAAYKLFCEMIDRGCVPNLVTYNIMIALQAKARNYQSVVKLYRDMQAAGFRPDKITYSIVMEVLGQCGHLDEAESVFLEMRRDWVPDEPAYGLLVDLWGKAGNVEKARTWYRAMLDAGLRPNVPTCNSLLSTFLRANRFADAYHVLETMLGLGLVPSLQTYTLLLSCCTETREQMGLCGQLMAITGHPAHTFLLHLPDAEPGGWNIKSHASYFFDLMHSEDRESKRGLVDSVIDFLHKSGLKEEAGFVWEVAAERNVYPDSVREKSSSYWLINLHLMSEGTAVTALSRTLAWFQKQLMVSGMGFQRIDIVTGWGRRSRVTGTSMVRRSVQELLRLFGFPFFMENGNSGCFVGCGESLNRWLMNSFVERMHLL